MLKERQKTLLDATVELIVAESEDPSERLLEIGFTKKEIIELGYGYLVGGDTDDEDVEDNSTTDGENYDYEYEDGCEDEEGDVW